MQGKDHLASLTQPYAPFQLLLPLLLSPPLWAERGGSAGKPRSDSSPLPLEAYPYCFQRHCSNFPAFRGTFFWAALKTGVAQKCRLEFRLPSFSVWCSLKPTPKRISSKTHPPARGNSTSPGAASKEKERPSGDRRSARRERTRPI